MTTTGLTHVTLVAVVRAFTANVFEPKLEECVPSPPYVPLTLGPVEPEAEGVKVTPQPAEDAELVLSVQLVALKTPAKPVSLKEIVPVGVVAPIVDVSVTVAVQVEA